MNRRSMKQFEDHALAALVATVVIFRQALSHVDGSVRPGAELSLNLEVSELVTHREVDRCTEDALCRLAQLRRSVLLRAADGIDQRDERVMRLAMRGKGPREGSR